MEAIISHTPHQKQHQKDDVFFMANGRNGNGHITPEELKNKLLEYKHQLKIVKKLYHTSSSGKTSTESKEDNTQHQVGHNNEEDHAPILQQVDHNNNCQPGFNDNTTLPSTPAVKLDNVNVKQRPSLNRRIPTARIPIPKTRKKQDSDFDGGANNRIPKKSTNAKFNISESNSPRRCANKSNKIDSVQNSPKRTVSMKSTKIDSVQTSPKRNARTNIARRSISQPRKISTSASMMQRSDSDLSTCSNTSSYTDRGSAFNSDIESKPRKKGVKSRKPVARSRSSVESNEIKTIYEQKFKELKEEMGKKIYLQDLSSSLKEKYFDTIRHDLQTKCDRHEEQIHNLQNDSRDHTTKSNEIQLKYHKLEFENTLLCNEYKRLKDDKLAIEVELAHCQKMLNQSYSIQQEVEKCLEKVQNNELSLASKLQEVQTENEGLKHDLETLQTLCMENDERVKYYQKMEIKLQECMHGAMRQISQLEKETIEGNVHHKIEFQKLLDQHERLQREHEAMKILYSDALRRVDESTKEKEELNRTFQQIRYQGNNELFYSNQSSRNHFPLSLTPAGSPGSVRKLSIRRTWFPQELSLNQFQPTTSRNSSEGESNQKICEQLCEMSSSSKKIPLPNRTPRRRTSYSSNNCESDSESFNSSSRSSSSLRSSTNDLQSDLPSRSSPSLLSSTNDLQSDLSSFRRQISSPATSDEPKKSLLQSWYVPVDKTNQNNNNNNNNNKPKENIAQTKRVPTLIVKPSQLKYPSTRHKSPRPSTIVSKESSKFIAMSTKSKIPSKPRPVIPTPCSVARTYLTTEEVLATVQEKSPLHKGKSNKDITRHYTTRLEQLCSYRDLKEAKEIVALEEKLKTLTDEKIKLDSQLGKIPTRSCSRNSRQSSQEETSLELKYEDVSKELGQVRYALKRLNAL